MNVPSVSSDVLSKVGPYLTLAEMLGSFHMQIARGGVEEVNLEYIGEFEELTTGPITVAFLKGSVHSDPAGRSQLCQCTPHC